MTPLREPVAWERNRVRVRAAILAASSDGLHLHQLREQLPDLSAFQLRTALLDLCIAAAIEQTRHGTYRVPEPEQLLPIDRRRAGR